MDEDSLNYLATVFGRLYDSSLRTTKECDDSSCSMRADGVCECTDYLRDVVDMIWEAKEGHPERFNAFMAEVEAEAKARDEGQEA